MPVMSPRIHHAREVLAQWLNENAGELRAELTEIVPPDPTKGFKGAGNSLFISSSYETQVDVNRFPLVMIDQASIEYEWEALDTGSGPVMRGAFNLSIYCAVHGYTSIVMDDLLSVLVGGITDTINVRHLDFEYRGFQYHWYETCPAKSVTFGELPRIQGALIQGAVIPVTLSWVRNMPQKMASLVTVAGSGGDGLQGLPDIVVGDEISVGRLD